VATLNIGQVCVKIAGREAGKYCVVIKKMDNNFVFITGPRELTGVKRRRCNIDHLEPASYFLKIKEDESDKEVIKAYETAGVLKKIGLKKPSPEKIKGEKPAKKPKKAKKEAKKEKKPKKSFKEKLLGKPKKKKEKKQEKPEKKPKKKPAKKTKKSKKKTSKKAKKKK